MTDRMATLTVEYGCTRSCQVEFDLSDVEDRFTYGQLLQKCDIAHVKAHELTVAKVRRPFPDVTVRAVALDGAVAL